MTDDVDPLVLDAILRRDFASFVAKVFATLNPGQVYDPNWHIHVICWQLMRMYQGKSHRLIVNVPPRSLKSTIISVAWCAWRLGHDATLRIICASYESGLAAKFSNDTRRVMESNWYKRLFPGARIDARKNTETEFRTTRGGGRLAVSVGGALTGRGGDILIIDDPLRAQDAMSEAARGRVNGWLPSTALSRLDNPERSEIIVVAQRLHVDDLCGRLLKSSAPWSHLMIPAMADVTRRYVLGKHRYQSYRKGDVLMPERLGKARLKTLRRELGSFAFSAQYLQMPRPPEGNLVKADYLAPRYDQPPSPEASGWHLLHSWDVATTTGATSDYSVCTIWRFNSERAVLLDVIRVQLDFPSLRRRAIELCERDRPEAVLVEAVGTGDVLAQELKGVFHSVIAIRPEGDKIVRLHRVLPMLEAGSILLPRSAPWLDTYLEELLSFPAGTHDDQVDSTTQALNWIRERERQTPLIVSAIAIEGPSYWRF